MEDNILAGFTVGKKTLLMLDGVAVAHSSCRRFPKYTVSTFLEEFKVTFVPWSMDLKEAASFALV